jgi:hypothetical protein
MGRWIMLMVGIQTPEKEAKEPLIAGKTGPNGGWWKGMVPVGT